MSSAIQLRLSDHQSGEARFDARDAAELRRRIVTAYAEMGGSGSFFIHVLTPTHERWVSVVDPDHALRGLSVTSAVITPEEADWLWSAIQKTRAELNSHFCNLDSLADEIAGEVEGGDACQ